MASPLQVGKYLISPIIRTLGPDRWSAAVSIRSGRGSMTHDRVMRLQPVFGSHDDAARHATEHGLAWIDAAIAASMPRLAHA
ncbi:MAG: hypothetical protein H6933_21140 [Burkholderiaceae bacterium]|nr:hypothetical protein [Burkholderiaceae bacterium]